VTIVAVLTQTICRRFNRDKLSLFRATIATENGDYSVDEALETFRCLRIN